MSVPKDVARSSVEKDHASESRTENVDGLVAGPDDADFGGESGLPPPPTLSEKQEKKLWRKIDLRLMPILSLLYLFSFMDRGNIGNARLQGLAAQLHLVGNQYNIALTMYFVPYIIFECPSNLLLKRFRPSRWLPGIMITWGIIMTLMGLVKTYPQLVGTRICLGVAEAGLFPGVVYYLTLWYPRHKLQYRFALFFGAASLAGAFSGLLAFGIGFMGGTGGLLGWSWIFILEGIVTILLGVVAFIVLVDYPATANFLTPEERAYIIWKKKYDNSSVGEEERFALHHVWDAFRDWQVWLLTLINISIVGPLYGITLFLPSIINTFGHSAATSQLLTVPPYVFATIILFLFAHYSDKWRMRSPFVLSGFIMCLIGYAINISNASTGAKYVGTFFIVAGIYAAFPGIIAWLGNNLAGQCKRAVGMALQIGIANLGGVIASNVYRAEDSPRYLAGVIYFIDGVELMFVGIGLISLPIAVFIYRRVNAKRDRAERERLEKGGQVEYSPQELRRLGDRAPDFRYML